MMDPVGMTFRPALFTPSIAAGKRAARCTSFPPQPPLAEEMILLNPRQVMLVSLVILTWLICF
jgi:hypothetical protein